MPNPLMRPASAPLRLIALRLALPELETVARQPDVVEAYRLSIHYHDGRFPDQVATLLRQRGQPGGRLQVAYRRTDDTILRYDYTVDSPRLDQFAAGLRRISFDKLDDMPDIPWFGADLWLVERAAGSFHHDLIVAPEKAVGVHADIVQAARTNLREAVRTINP